MRKVKIDKEIKEKREGEKGKETRRGGKRKERRKKKGEEETERRGVKIK